MANTDAPMGFWPIRHLCGGEIRLSEHICTTSAAIFKGDPLKVVAGGTVEVAAADDGLIVIGVAAEYVASAAAGDTVKVWDDPNIVFGVQADSGTSPAATDVYNTANFITYAAGSTTTGLSIMELDASDIGTGAQLKILGKIPDPDNVWGEHVNLEVVFNEHFLKAAVAGV